MVRHKEQRLGGILGASLLIALGATVASADPGSARVNARSLPAKISIESVPMIRSPELVPAAPGPESAATLTGVDSNRNGIRDDIERWIAQNYPDCARYRAALAQVALAAQRRMSMGELTQERARQLAVEEGGATACLAVESESCATASLEKFIQFSLLLQNTPERGLAYARVYRKLGNKAFGLPGEGCTIPSGQLPD